MTHTTPPQGWSSNLPYQPPRCECHDCTQARARGQLGGGQMQYVEYPHIHEWTTNETVPRCLQCGAVMVQGNR